MRFASEQSIAGDVDYSILFRRPVGGLDEDLHYLNLIRAIKLQSVFRGHR